MYITFKKQRSKRILGTYSVMALGSKSEGTEPRMGDMLCAGKRFEIEVALNGEMSSQVELRKEKGENVECSRNNSNGNQHAHGVFPKTYSVKQNKIVKKQ